MNAIPSVEIPIGQKGIYRVERKKIEPSFLSNFHEMKNGRGGVPKGEYTFLYRNNSLIMSDTPDEKRDHYTPVYKAKGNCLIAGLGIGMVLNAIATKPEVEKIDVVEISQDVLDLVAPFYQKKFGSKIVFYQQDIFEFVPQIKYDMAWFDIWDNLCTDNLEQMTKLHRKFAKKAEWKGSWGKEYLQYQKRKERAYYNF